MRMQRASTKRVAIELQERASVACQVRDLWRSSWEDIGFKRDTLVEQRLIDAQRECAAWSYSVRRVMEMIREVA